MPIHYETFMRFEPRMVQGIPDINVIGYVDHNQCITCANREYQETPIMGHGVFLNMRENQISSSIFVSMPLAPENYNPLCPFDFQTYLTVQSILEPFVQDGTSVQFIAPLECLNCATERDQEQQAAAEKTYFSNKNIEDLQECSVSSTTEPESTIHSSMAIAVGFIMLTFFVLALFYF